MFPKWIYDKFMPISLQPILVKLVVGLLMHFRVLFGLIADCIRLPETLVITRCIAVKVMPVYYKWLLHKIAEKAFVIWDYDDQIIEGGEVSQNTFNFYAEIADQIFCTHTYLADLLPDCYRHKVILLPTTDGDMYRDYHESAVNQTRLDTLTSEVKLVWVATCVNLPHLLMIAPWLDRIAAKLQSIKGKSLSLEVICNGALNYDFKYLHLINTPWTRQRAIEGMNRANIGIMPLTNNEYALGKGGFKLVQYLSVGLPCIASNLGFNKKVINQECGFLATTEQQWQQAIFSLSEPSTWHQFSIAAFQQWNNCFSFEKNLTIWQNTLLRIKSKQPS
jgi:glycosyltransferase involved in cell wall biosynthesis